MSFWRKIGLADATSVEAMKAEILALRQENSALHDTQSKHMKQAHDSCLGCVRETAMSFESKVAVISEQLQALRPELISCLRDSKQEILSSGDSYRDHVMRQLTIVLDNQEQLKESISSAKTSREMALAQIVGLINDLKSAQEHARRDLIGQYSELSKASQTISDGLVSLKENADIQSSVSKRIVDQIGSGHEDLKKILNATQGVVEDISFLNKYSESIWEAIKLVWINELLDDAKK